MSKLQTPSTILLVTLAVMGAASASLAAEHGDGHLMVTPDELEWGPIASMAPGAKMAMIEGDLSQAEPFTFRYVQARSDLSYPRRSPSNRPVSRRRRAVRRSA